MPPTQEEDDLLPPYTIWERSRELRQRSVMLCARAQRLRARSMQLLHKQAGAAPGVMPTACPLVLCSQQSSQVSPYAPHEGEDHVHWLYVGETLRRGAGPRTQ